MNDRLTPFAPCSDTASNVTAILRTVTPIIYRFAASLANILIRHTYRVTLVIPHVYRSFASFYTCYKIVLETLRNICYHILMEDLATMKWGQRKLTLIRQILTKEYGPLCMRCGHYNMYGKGQFRKRIKMCVEHIIPLSKGGTCDISNLQLFCHHCNSSKNVNTWNMKDSLTKKEIQHERSRAMPELLQSS